MQRHSEHSHFFARDYLIPGGFHFSHSLGGPCSPPPAPAQYLSSHLSCCLRAQDLWFSSITSTICPLVPYNPTLWSWLPLRNSATAPLFKFLPRTEGVFLFSLSLSLSPNRTGHSLKQDMWQTQVPTVTRACHDGWFD